MRIIGKPPVGPPPEKAPEAPCPYCHTDGGTVAQWQQVAGEYQAAMEQQLRPKADVREALATLSAKVTLRTECPANHDPQSELRRDLFLPDGMVLPAETEFRPTTDELAAELAEVPVSPEDEEGDWSDQQQIEFAVSFLESRGYTIIEPQAGGEDPARAETPPVDPEQPAETKPRTRGRRGSHGEE